MAAPAQVTWAKVGADGSRIARIGGKRRTFFGTSNWELTSDDAIAMIEQDEWKFFIETGGNKEWLEISERPDGRKILVADGPIKRLL